MRDQSERAIAFTSGEMLQSHPFRSQPLGDACFRQAGELTERPDAPQLERFKNLTRSVFFDVGQLVI